MLINEVFTVRARYLRARVEGATVQAQSVISVDEQPDGDDQCVFTIRCRPEKLQRAFDFLTEAHDQFYKLPADQDFSICMNRARAALVTAQMEAIGIEDERAPRQLHVVYKEMLPSQIFKQMDETYQRVSKALHGESKSAEKMAGKQAWGLLRDVRRCVYALELLDIDEAKRKLMRDRVSKLSRLVEIEELAEKAKGLDPQERHALKELVARLKKGAQLTEEGQRTLGSVLRKIGGKAWEIGRPILSDVATAAIKTQFNLD